MTHFEGTEHETRTCPRRHLLRNPDLVGIFDLRRSCDGHIGIDGARNLSAAACEGLAIVDDAVGHRLEWEAKERAALAGVNHAR